MTPPIDPTIGTAAEALKSVQDLAAQVAGLRQERNNWQTDAEQQFRNVQYYRGLLLEAAKHLGEEVYVLCDDGSRSADPLVSKVPELVSELRRSKDDAEKQLGYLSEFLGLGGATWAFVVSETISAIEQLRAKRDNAHNAASIHSRNEITYYCELERIFELLKHGGPVTFGEGHLAGLVEEKIRTLEKKVANLEFNDGKADLQIQLLSVETANKLLLNEVEQLRRENETLARQVPSTPPAIPVSDLKPEDLVVEGILSIDPGAFRKFVGQQWCSTIDRGFRVTDDISIQVAPGMWVVLCNVYSDLNSGGLTYEPVAVSDLPKIP